MAATLYRRNKEGHNEYTDKEGKVVIVSASSEVEATTLYNSDNLGYQVGDEVYSLQQVNRG